MAVQIIEAKTKKQIRTFVNFPNQMYQDVPQFVPAFYGDDLSDWDKNKNPAFSYCEARAFLAYKDGVLVGRIGAILSHKANETWNTRRMRFSQVDFIDDPEVSAALFAAVENWAREKGCNEVHGPLGFCDLDREGMLVEGYDRRNMFITYYNFPYYNEHLTRLGYQKHVDWVEYKLMVPKVTDPSCVKVHTIAEMVMKRGSYHKADMSNRKQYKPYVRQFFELVNEAYAHLYGVVDLNAEQIEKYADKFIPLINPDYCCLILDNEEKLVGFGVACPSVAASIKKSRGRLFPTGWIGVLKSLWKNTAIDLLLIAVRPELQKQGINAIIIDHIMQSCIKNGIEYAETGPQLETNSNVLNQWNRFESELHKRRRCYIKSIVTTE